VRGSSLSSVHKWVEEKSNGTDRLFFVVEHLGSQQPIGYIQLQEEPNATRTFRFGICLTPTYQSQGYGSEAILAVEHFLKLNFYIYKMILHVDSQNSSAIACYKKLAYREVGVMYCHVFIQGSLRDVVIMEKLLSSQLG
jgi:RimJ/RimL family protein N-acetyltransferase